MTRALELVEDALATYRLTKLATDDVILRGPREAAIRWAYESDDARRHRLDEAAGDDPGDLTELALGDDDAPKLARLVTCPWCAGVWIAAGVLMVKRCAPRSWRPVGELLTLAAAAALVKGLERG